MNKPFLIKNIKTKKTKTDQKRPYHDAYNTQTNIHEHWSQRPIRRSMPVGDDWQAPGWRRYNRKNRRDTLTSTHRPKIPRNKQQNAVTAGITTNQHTTHLEVSNRIYPIQGSFTLPCIPFSSLSSPRLVDRSFCIYRRYRYKNPLAKDNPHLFSLHHSCIEPTPSQPHRYYFLICKIQNSLATNKRV